MTGSGANPVYIAFLNSQSGVAVSANKKVWHWDGRTWKDISSILDENFFQCGTNTDLELNISFSSLSDINVHTKAKGR